MPRAVFSASAFNSAAPGLGKLAAAIGGGGDAFDQGRESAILFQSKLAQALAAQQASEASARHSDAGTLELGAKTKAHEFDLGQRQPDMVRNNAMQAYGIPLDESTAVGEFLKTGALGGKYAAPVDGMGPVAPQPDWASKLGAVGRLVGGTQNALTVGDKNTENIAKVGDIQRTQGLQDQVLSGAMTPMALAAAQYASKGSAPFHFTEAGVGNNLTGAMDDSGPVAQRFGNNRIADTAYKGAQKLQSEASAGASKASAANSYASADQHRASTAKTRQEMEQGVKTGQIQIVTDTNGNVTLVDKATGLARPAMMDGKPLQGKGGSLNGEQANALTFASRMSAAQDILNTMAGKGIYTRGVTKMAADGVPDWAGGGLAQAGANFAQSPEQQQVEQAQRDFVNAVLRRESGAAISMGEFSNANKQYFPQPGDSKAVKQQKMEARQRVIQGMMAAVPPNMRTLPEVRPPVSGGAAPSAQRNVVVDW